MAVLTAARFITITDALAAAMLAAKGTGANGLGVRATEEPSDDIGARGRLGDLNAAIMAFAEDDYTPLLAGIRDSIDNASYEHWVEEVMGDAMDALNDMCADSGLTGVTSITSFAGYYNIGAGGPWSALMAPDFRTLYGIWAGSAETPSYPVATNVYSPAIASLATKVVGGAFTSVAEIDDDKYAGAARAFATVGTLTGTGTAIVTGTARTSSGTTVAGRTWSCEIADGTATLLVPQNTGDLIISVSAISMDAGISAGTLTVSAAIPSGRTNPPA